MQFQKPKQRNGRAEAPRRYPHAEALKTRTRSPSGKTARPAPQPRRSGSAGTSGPASSWRRGRGQDPDWTAAGPSGSPRLPPGSGLRFKLIKELEKKTCFKKMFLYLHHFPQFSIKILTLNPFLFWTFVFKINLIIGVVIFFLNLTISSATCTFHFPVLPCHRKLKSSHNLWFNSHLLQSMAPSVFPSSTNPQAVPFLRLLLSL